MFGSQPHTSPKRSQTRQIPAELLASSAGSGLRRSPPPNARAIPAELVAASSGIRRSPVGSQTTSALRRSPIGSQATSAIRRSPVGSQPTSAIRKSPVPSAIRRSPVVAAPPAVQPALRRSPIGGQATTSALRRSPVGVPAPAAVRRSPPQPKPALRRSPVVSQPATQPAKPVSATTSAVRRSPIPAPKPAPKPAQKKSTAAAPPTKRSPPTAALPAKSLPRKPSQTLAPSSPRKTSSAAPSSPRKPNNLRPRTRAPPAAPTPSAHTTALLQHQLALEHEIADLESALQTERARLSQFTAQTSTLQTDPAALADLIARLRHNFTTTLPAEKLQRTEYTFEHALAATPCSVLPQASSAAPSQIAAFSPLVFTEYSYTPEAEFTTTLSATGHAHKTLYFSISLCIDLRQARILSLRTQLPLWARRELGAFAARCEEEGDVHAFLSTLGEYAEVCRARVEAMGKVRGRWRGLCKVGERRRGLGGLGERVLRLGRGGVEVTVRWAVEVGGDGVGSRVKAELRWPKGWRGMEKAEGVEGLFVGLCRERGWVEAVGGVVEAVFPGTGKE